jgi:thiamine-monophosphate kinase
MCLNDEIMENRFINFIAGNFRKSPLKLNNIHEADAELIDIGRADGNLLAITTDSLAEEISSGLYDEPYLAGWMLVVANLSDLAAVGAKPLGMLISLTLKESHRNSYIEKLTQGIDDACRQAGTYILGGDTNQGETDYLSGCALGLAAREKMITRIGARPGDRLYLSAPAGSGNIFALTKFNGHDKYADSIAYKPSPRLDDGLFIRDHANCCIDTSDGVIHAVDTLMRLNNVKIILNNNWEDIIDHQALAICRTLKIQPWLTLAGIHGEFELCFTTGRDRNDEFIRAAGQRGWSPILLGEIQEGSGIFVRQGQNDIPMDTTTIRNLSFEANRDVLAYSERLLDLADKSKIE